MIDGLNITTKKAVIFNIIRRILIINSHRLKDSKFLIKN